MNIKINGISIYYHKTGSGSPVLCIHGNGEDHTIFAGLIKELSSSYTVYAPDSRDHGRSTRTNSLTYEQMTDDLAVFIQTLHIKNPIIIGFSDGGIIGLLLSIRYPKLISKLIIAGANTNPSGLKKIPRLFWSIQHFFTRDHKLALMLKQPDIKKDQLRAVSVPTLVLAGSQDLIYRSHTKELAQNIPGSTLKILKKETHDSYIKDYRKLHKEIIPFISI